jgi:cell division septation protein DedD
MAGNGKRGGDRVLESRHLVIFFLGVVILCGVFFTLGYVMGKTQYGGSVHAESPEKMISPVRKAAKPTEPGAVPGAAPVPANNEWDFYSKNNNNNLEPVSKPASPPAGPSPISSGGKTSNAPAGPASAARTIPVSARFQPPKMLKGSVVLQIAALTHQSDALAMADVLQQKKFPSFVVTPSTDNFYRVQVGPYADQRAAESARDALDHAGFKAILKR